LKRARPPLATKLRRGRLRDLDALMAIEDAVFTTDNLSRRGFRHFLTARSATLMVAEEGGNLAGYVLVRYSSRNTIARVYSIAVNPKFRRQGIGGRLLAAAERDAKRRRCGAIRLEIHEHNPRSIAFHEKSGYSPFGRHSNYYDDGGDALRFEKPLGGEARSRRRVRHKSA